MKVLKYISGLIIIGCVLFTILIGSNKISQTQIDNNPSEYKGIITVWQVDSFEGGIGSRKQFLLKVARSFEKKHEGVFVMVSNYTVDGVYESLKNNSPPDIISFGNGTEVSGFSKLNINIDFNGGKVGDGTYAVPWCRGGYVLIANPRLASSFEEEIDKLLVSQGEYTQPLTALTLEDCKVKQVEVKKPLDAYVQFVGGSTPFMLGTQRDLMRLKNRNMEVNIKPLEKYNDLYQYVVITSTEQVKRCYAEKFLEYLMSEEIQKKLYDIGMYSEVYDVETDDQNARLMQAKKKFLSVSAFTSSVELKQMQKNSYLAFNGDQEALNKIKNMLV